MKISPLGGGFGAIATAAPATAPVNPRTITLKTNATPGLSPEEIGAIPDNDGQANVEPEETKPLSPQFAALARQRRALQLKEQELAAKEKALTESGKPSLDLTALKSNPLSVLEQAGVTYDDLTNAILANQNGVTPEIIELRAKIKALEEGVDKKLSDREQQAEQQALAQMKREALQLAQQGDNFEMVRETRSVPDVMRLIERTYRETGEVLDVAQAMQLVEDELVKDSLRIAQLKKVQSRLVPEAPQLPQNQNQPRQTRTLTNRDTARAVMSAKARAIAAFNGQLKR